MKNISSETLSDGARGLVFTSVQDAQSTVQCHLDLPSAKEALAFLEANQEQKTKQKVLRSAIRKAEAAKPGYLTVSMTWWNANTRKPDSDMTVMVCNRKWDNPVWMGYWDSADEVWMEIDGSICEPPPVAWADLPEDPEDAP